MSSSVYADAIIRGGIWLPLDRGKIKLNQINDQRNYRQPSFPNRSCTRAAFMAPIFSMRPAQSQAEKGKGGEAIWNE